MAKIPAPNMLSERVGGLTAREHMLIAHVRGWCHNGAICDLCKAENRAHRAERELDRIISG